MFYFSPVQSKIATATSLSCPACLAQRKPTPTTPATALFDSKADCELRAECLENSKPSLLNANNKAETEPKETADRCFIH